MSGQLVRDSARYYDPGLGRFISADTMVPGAGSLTVSPNDPVAAGAWSQRSGGPANPQQLNRYSYVLNNPVKSVDPTGHCPMCIGALIGGGIDLAVQLVSNGGNVEKVNWVQVGVSAAVGATGVGLGGVIANATKSVALNIALNTVASAGVSAIGAEVQNRAQEALTPGQFASVDPVRAAATGAITGGVGAAVGEVARVGANALASAKYNSLSLGQKLLLNSSAIIPDSRARSMYDHIYGVGSFTSTTISNTGPVLPSNVTDRLPASSGKQ